MADLGSGCAGPPKVTGAAGQLASAGVRPQAVGSPAGAAQVEKCFALVAMAGAYSPRPGPRLQSLAGVEAKPNEDPEPGHLTWCWATSRVSGSATAQLASGRHGTSHSAERFQRAFPDHVSIMGSCTARGLPRPREGTSPGLS
jgi:hypothetical protein